MSDDEREARRARARVQREAAERAAARSDQRKRRLLTLGGILAAAAAVVVVVVLVAGGGKSSTSAPRTAAGDTLAGQSAIQEQLGGIDQKGIALGRADAPITIVEYGDLQCPVCAAFSNTVLPSVVDKYVRTGKARIQFRNISFIGDDSVRLAKMAAAAGEQNKLFDFIELVYANQGEENSGYATDAYLKQIASAIPGLDVQKALRDRTSAAVTNQLDEAQRLATASKVNETPTIFVGRSGQTPTHVQPAALERTLQQLASTT